MDSVQYKQKLEQGLIKEFMEKFYEKVGYYPMVVTDVKHQEGIKILTLSELEKYFTPYTPKVFGKKVILSSKNRSRPLVELRFIFFFIARQMRYGLLEIGQHLGKRDHTTVLHGLKTFKNLYETDIQFKAKYHKIINQIKLDYEPSAVDYLNQMESES